MTQTFSMTTTDAWQEVLKGATFKSFGVQISGTHEVQIAISTAQPGAGTDDFVALDDGGDRSFSCDLDAADIVYARAATTGRQIKLRGYKVAR